MRRSFDDARRFGRRGEVVTFIYLVHVCNFVAFDQSATANNCAPKLHAAIGNMIAPDAWLFHECLLLGEFKTKDRHPVWRNEGENRLPEGRFQGIDGHVFHAYDEANKRVPVVLFILCQEDGTLYAASLDQLGCPTPSLRPAAHPMVNWPLSLFTQLVAFDQNRLTLFLNKPLDVERMPDNEAGERLLEWLRPQQYELVHFRADLMHRLERRWGWKR